MSGFSSIVLTVILTDEEYSLTVNLYLHKIHQLFQKMSFCHGNLP